MKVIATDKAPGAIGPYSQGFIANGFVFTSGQIPVVPETGTVPEGIAAQTAQSCKMSELSLKLQDRDSTRS